MALTLIGNCAATSCAFNNGGCSAAGITIGGHSGYASCETYLEADARAASDGDATVGACKRMECKHNEALRCTAESIEITADSKGCASYEAN